MSGIKLKPPKPLNRAAYLAYFEAWLAPKLETGELSATRFGYFAVGEPAFLARLRDGKLVRAETLEAAVAYCKRYGKRAGAKLRNIVPSDDASPADAETLDALPALK